MLTFPLFLVKIVNALAYVHFFSNFGRRLLEGNSYLAMLERIFQHSPEITVAKCSPYYSTLVLCICAGYALA